MLRQTDFEPICYERRIVCFFDILGWKQHIKKAGSDPVEISRLTFLPRLLTSKIVKDLNSKSSQFTSFSDCNVVSFTADEVDVERFVSGLSQIFLAAATEGFFLRAGVTVGDIYHDENMVFGPALNRAYQLEDAGKYPRIVLDELKPELTSLSCAQKDGETVFVEAFDCAFRNDEANRSDVIAAIVRAESLILQSINDLRRNSDDSENGRHPTPLEKMEWLYPRVRKISKSILNRVC